MFQWFRNWKRKCFTPNYQVDENYENIVRLLIDRHREVEFLESDEQEFVLKLEDYYFRLWIANYPYAYLSRIRIGKLKRDHVYNKDEWWKCINELVCIDGGMPSKQTIIDFYDRFHAVCRDAQIAARCFQRTKIVNDVLANLHQK